MGDPALPAVEGRRVLPELARERRVICPDLRGLGWSDAPPGAYTKEGWAADLLGLLDVLGLDRPDLVGHDWGGLAVLLAALRARDRLRSVTAVSIVHPWPRPPAPSPRVLAPLAYQLPLALPVAGAGLLGRMPVLVRELMRRGSGPGHRWTDASSRRMPTPCARPRAPARAARCTGPSSCARSARSPAATTPASASASRR